MTTTLTKASLCFSLVTMMMSDNSSATTTTIGCDPARLHFVLVHGYGGGAWGWYKVRTLLEASGFKVTCLDLKASGVDPSSCHSVTSFEAYNQPLIDFFTHYSPTQPDEKVILVGHSAGGLSVTDATHKFSNKIHVAVYLAATMLNHGFATEQDKIDGIPPSIRTGSKSEPDPRILAEDATLSSMLMRPGPIAVLEAKFSGTKADKVPRVYLKTLKDQVLKLEQQEAMISRWPPARVFALDTNHNPPLTDPFLLSGLLVKAANMS